MNDNLILGLDIGGAHLKAALLDRHDTRWVGQWACPLWRGLDHLERALDAVEARIGAGLSQCAVTMTGELADIFRDRRDGVMQLSALVARRFSNAQVYAGSLGFVAPQHAAEHVAKIASTNWLASAQLVAAHIPDALFIDLGSTTTDILAIRNATVTPSGYNDTERLRTGELVYAGVVRTPLMALARRVNFRGASHGVAAEYFATTSDVYRLTGELEEAHDMADTADSAPKTVEASARRLARMVGCDLGDADMEEWRALAHEFRHLQSQEIVDAARLLLETLPAAAPVVGAGAGRFLLRQLAGEIGRAYVDYADLVTGDASAKSWAAVCAPSHAVAWLAAREV